MLLFQLSLTQELGQISYINLILMPGTLLETTKNTVLVLWQITPNSRM